MVHSQWNANLDVQDGWQEGPFDRYYSVGRKNYFSFAWE